MEMIDVMLSIVASALSIVATVVAFKSKKGVDRLRDLYEGNKLNVTGNENTQVVGTGNRVNTHDK